MELRTETPAFMARGHDHGHCLETALDRDYLTVPEQEIEDIRILMTMVGGRVVHLVPSLARELGMSPKGAEVELGGPAAAY